MNAGPVLLDTAYVQALLNKADQHHARAMALFPTLRGAEKWITEAVLIEIGDGMCAIGRLAAARFIRRCYETPETRIIPLSTPLLLAALVLFEARPDKFWSLTDCISFVVMRDHGLTAALTADRHFVQAGFRALLLEEP